MERSTTAQTGCAIPRRALILLLGLLALVAGASRSNAQSLQGGRHYLIAFPGTVKNAPPRTPEAGAPRTFDDQQWVMLFSTVRTRVTVTAPGITIDTVVDPARSTVIRLDSASRRFIEVVDDRRTDIIEIRSEEPIAVYAYFATVYGAEAFTPLPVDLWGTDYLVSGLPSYDVTNVMNFQTGEEGPFKLVYAPGQILVIAAEDGTEVTIESKENLGDWWRFRRRLVVTLNAGEAYLVQPGKPPVPLPDEPPLDDGVADLARTTVRSTRPIGVLTGNTRSLGNHFRELPKIGNSMANAMLEWLAPRSHAGTIFVYRSPWAVAGTSSEDLIRAYNIGLDRNYISGTFDFGARMILPGGMAEYSLGWRPGNDGNFWLRSTAPAQASAAGGAIGIDADPGGFEESVHAYSTASVELVPHERWGTYTRFHIPEAPAQLRNVVTLSADLDAVVLLDGIEIDGWTPIFLQPYKTVLLELPPGDYAVTSSNGRFTGIVAGRTRGFHGFRPLRIDAKDGADLASAMPHPSIYQEIISVAYAYPLVPGHLESDSLEFDSSSTCEGSLATIDLVRSPAGAASYVLRAVDSMNARVEITERRQGVSVIGWQVRFAPVDSTRDARAALEILSAFGSFRRVPFAYSAHVIEMLPERAEQYNVPVGVARDFAIAVHNRGTSPSHLGYARLARGDRGFAIVGAPAPQPIAAGTHVEVPIRFTQTEYARRYVDSLIVGDGCWSDTIEIAARTLSLVKTPLPLIDGIDWRRRWVTTASACTKSGTARYDSVITIRNGGNLAFAVARIELVGPDADSGFFRLDSSNAATTIRLNDPIYPDSIRRQGVVFRPRDEREYRCRVRLVAVRNDTVEAELVGIGIETHLAVEPDPIDLGASLLREPGAILATATAIVRALPTRPLTVSRLRIDGPASVAIDASAGFVTPSPSDPATWWRLAPGESRAVPLVFVPLDTGRVDARLVVEGDHARCDDSTIAITGRAYTVVANIAVPDFSSAIDCGETRGVARIVNSGTVPLRLDAVAITPSGAPFAIEAPPLPVTIAAGAALAIPIRFTPPGAGVFDAAMEVDVRDTSGSVRLAIEPAALRGVSRATSVRASIARDHRVAPGGATPIDVLLDDPVDGAGVRSFEADVTIDPQLFRVLTASTAELTDGWRVDVLERSDSLLRVRVESGDGSTLRGTGPLLSFDAEGYISETLSSAIPFTVRFPARSCVAVATTPGHVQLDSVCGLSFRLLMPFTMSYALDRVVLAPDAQSAHVAVSIGMEQRVVVEVFDALGRRVARVADAELVPGRHTVAWDASPLGNGVYILRASTDGWSATRGFVIAR